MGFNAFKFNYKHMLKTANVHRSWYYSITPCWVSMLMLGLGPITLINANISLKAVFYDYIAVWFGGWGHWRVEPLVHFCPQGPVYTCSAPDLW